MNKPDEQITADRPNFAYGDFEPCPFCGNYQIKIYKTAEGKYYAGCFSGDSCGASTFRGSSSIKYAAAAWNNRATIDGTAKLEIAFRHACGELGMGEIDLEAEINRFVEHAEDLAGK